jgi:hypothetical protein
MIPEPSYATIAQNHRMGSPDQEFAATAGKQLDSQLISKPGGDRLAEGAGSNPAAHPIRKPTPPATVWDRESPPKRGPRLFV